MAEEKLQRSRKVPESDGKKTTCWSWEICWDNRFIIQQVFMLCLPCNVAREEFSISMCEILSSALSPSCTKLLVTKSQCSVSSASPFLHWFPPGAAPLKAHRPWAHPLGEAMSVWTVLCLVVFVHIVSFPYRDVIGIMIRELKHSCPKQICLYT